MSFHISRSHVLLLLFLLQFLLICIRTKDIIKSILREISPFTNKKFIAEIAFQEKIYHWHTVFVGLTPYPYWNSLSESITSDLWNWLLLAIHVSSVSIVAEVHDVSFFPVASYFPDIFWFYSFIETCLPSKRYSFFKILSLSDYTLTNNISPQPCTLSFVWIHYMTPNNYIFIVFSGFSYISTEAAILLLS